MENKRNNWQTAPWDIRPSDGIGPLKFGMTLEEVLKVSGWEVENIREYPTTYKEVFFTSTPDVSLLMDPDKDSLIGISFFSDTFWGSVKGEVLVEEPWRELVQQLAILNKGTYRTNHHGTYNFDNLRIGMFDEACGDDSCDGEHRAVNLTFYDGVTKLWK